MAKMTCSKTYSDIPFAHRQHRHSGHCSRIHGHNWTLKLTFACSEYDENGFVVDFGNLKYIREWLDEHLDHACVLSADDPLKEKIVGSVPEVYALYEVSNASCEGIAEHLYGVISGMVREREAGRVWVESVELFEDGKNSVRYEG